MFKYFLARVSFKFCFQHDIFKRWIYCWWVAGTMPVDVSGSFCTKGPHPWYLKLQPWFLALSCVQLKHNLTFRHNLKCFCEFSWVCWSLVSLLKFPQGFRMKRGAGCFIALPWLPDHSSPLICQSWGAGANVKEQCKMLLCRQCMYKSAAAGRWNVVLWVYATSLQCTICTLVSIFTSQPNKLRPTVKVVFWYIF